MKQTNRSKVVENKTINAQFFQAFYSPRFLGESKRISSSTIKEADADIYPRRPMIQTDWAVGLQLGRITGIRARGLVRVHDGRINRHALG
jgi:hypothetical protein